MFNKIKLITGMEWSELTTVIIVLAVGYPFLSKFGFYSRLGIDWYLSTGNAFSIFITSISVMFLVLLGFSSGILTYFLLKLLKNIYLKMFVALGLDLLIIILVTIPLFYYDSQEVMKVLLKFNYVEVSISLIIFGVFLVVLTLNDFIKELSNLGIFSNINLAPYFLIILVVVLGAFSWSHGRAEADNVWKFRDQILNSLKLNNPNEKWYLVDYTGDKALILKEGSGLIFKIVEYKDIKQIMPPEQEMSQINGIYY